MDNPRPWEPLNHGWECFDTAHSSGSSITASVLVGKRANSTGDPLGLFELPGEPTIKPRDHQFSLLLRGRRTAFLAGLRGSLLLRTPFGFRRGRGRCRLLAAARRRYVLRVPARTYACPNSFYFTV